jgi:hypothetical protein
VCTYQSIIDVNGNTKYLSYDAFGRLRSLSYTSALTKITIPQSLDDVIEHPELYLTDGIDRFFYNDFSQKALCSAEIIRKDETRDGETSAPALALTYFDSYGRIFGRAVRDTDNWIIFEKNIYANDMKILEYPPYYSPNPQGEPTTYPNAYKYDALGRVIKSYTPCAEPALVWRSQENEYSPWYLRTIDHRIDSPDICPIRSDFDSRGFALTEICENANGEILRSKIVRDSGGNITSLSDGRLAASGKNNISMSYDRLMRVIKTVSADAGTSLKLYGHGERLIYEYSNGIAKLYTYDTLGRFVSLRQHRTKIVCVLRSQIFRQIS